VLAQLCYGSYECICVGVYTHVGGRVTVVANVCGRLYFRALEFVLECIV